MSNAAAVPDNVLIINVALTGMVPTRAESPYVPLTVEEIVADCRAVSAAGASVVHLHPRDAAGKPTTNEDIYRRLIGEVRAACPDLVISATCSGRVEKTFEARAVPLNFTGDLKPDLASLTCGSMNFPRQASVTDPEMIAALAARMAEVGVKPELEIFEPGMLNVAKYLLGKGQLAAPLYMNILLGGLGTCPAEALDLAYMVNGVPPGTIWSAAGIGRYQLTVNALAVAMGGHVRVGLEDNLYYDWAARTPASNEALVARVVRIAAELGRRPATPAEARALLQFPERAA